MLKHCIALSLVVAASAAFVSVAQAEGGSCQYKQHAPKVDRWVSVCQMPMSQSSCEALALDRYKGEVKYGEGACATKAASAVCVINGEKVFFYGGNLRAHQRGCEFLKGAWRPDLTPTTAAN